VIVCVLRVDKVFRSINKATNGKSSPRIVAMAMAEGRRLSPRVGVEGELDRGIYLCVLWSVV
jgi:hypothetical protein